MTFNVEKKEFFLIGFFSILVSSFPVFSLTIKGWVSAVLFTSSFLAILLYFHHKLCVKDESNIRKELHQLPTIPKIYCYFFCLAFFLPLLSVMLSQFLIGDWVISRFDGPSRYIFSLLVFLVIFQMKTPIEKLFQYSFPVAALITLIASPYLPQTGWAIAFPDRLTNYFIDPLIFGQLCLVFGVLSLASINSGNIKNYPFTLIKFLGAVVGIYLSLKSGSRTGWPAIPILMLWWGISLIRGSKLKALLISMIVTIMLLAISYQISSIIRDKVDSLSHQIGEYSWNSVNEHTSIGARISFTRIGFYYFFKRPISGWGNGSLNEHINDAELANYANQDTRDELVRVGFHNDFISNMVHFGVLGLLSTIFIFTVPALFFIYCLRQRVAVAYAQFGIAYILVQSISSLSYHVLDFKFMASFYALMISILMGVTMSKFKAQQDR
jgi:O-antigen ligase